MLNNKDYCDYDTCVALKELGYNRGGYAYYYPNHKEDLIFNTHQMRGCSINEMVKAYNTYPSDVIGHELIDAPTMLEAQKWLREEKNIIVVVSYYQKTYEYNEHWYWILYQNGYIEMAEWMQKKIIKKACERLKNTIDDEVLVKCGSVIKCTGIDVFVLYFCKKMMSFSTTKCYFSTP